MHLSENTILQAGKYHIIRTLGQGGFGITYLALQTGLNREVVLKEFFMKDYCDRDKNTRHVTLGTKGSREMIGRYLEKFGKEARNIAALDHPNIVRIIDIFEENNTAYYVMEYHSEGSLSSIVKQKGAMNEKDALNYISQVASALKFVHSNRMMHLDIKPDNILLNKRGEAVLIDFGISKHYNNHGKATSTPNTSGISPGYTPLEQYDEGGVGEFSPATDIYSLGATLYTLLTGMIPPPAMQLVNNQALTNELIKKGINSQIISAVVKSMSIAKGNRPQDINEFLSLLNKATNVTQHIQQPISIGTSQEIVRLRGCIIKLEAENNNLKYENNSLKQEIADRRAENEALRQEIDSLRAYAMEQKETIFANRQKIATLQQLQLTDSSKTNNLNIEAATPQNRINREENTNEIRQNNPFVNDIAGLSSTSRITQEESPLITEYRKAAEQGNAIAQYNLGVCYQYGNGVPKNQAEAINWYKKAAKQGDIKASQALERLKQ